MGNFGITPGEIKVVEYTIRMIESTPVPPQLVALVEEQKADPSDLSGLLKPLLSKLGIGEGKKTAAAIGDYNKVVEAYTQAIGESNISHITARYTLTINPDGTTSKVDNEI